MQYKFTELNINEIDSVNGITELNVDEIDSVNGGQLTGEGIAAGVGTFVGGLGGTYFGFAALALAPGLVAGAAGAAVFGLVGYSLYLTAEAILD
jgi:hypothetical protein